MLIELKNAKEDLIKGFNDNITNYKRDIPQLFWYNLFCVVSNGSQTRVGSVSAEWEHYFTWLQLSEKAPFQGVGGHGQRNTIKSIEEKSKTENRKISLELFAEGLCNKDSLLDYFENFVLFSHKGETPVNKIIAKNHQYHGVNNSVEAYRNREGNQGKLGIFWHTQGSGKSYSMIFFSRKLERKLTGNFSFLIITDRTDLNAQIWRNFHETETINEKDDFVPKTRKRLKEFLTSNRAFVFSLIHGFGTKKGIQYKKISDRNDWIVIIDEAHRTQYKTLAENMRIALPNAQYIAFTGTPLLENEMTAKWFGEYVSQYNFAQSIEDGATVPIFYNKRVPEVIVSNEELEEEMTEIFEEEDLTPEQQEKLEKEYGTLLEVVKREDRLHEIAKDIVKHFPHRLNARDKEGNPVPHKAMVISIDKFTALKMHDMVEEEIKNSLKEINSKISKAPDEREKYNLKKQKQFLKETKLAVVISEEAGENEKFAKYNLNIRKHRKLFISDPDTGNNIEDYFKNPTNKIRIVFVCSMWLTGFDAPSVSTLYLDKPMQNHTLMQAIARANRVFPGKTNGLVIDYFGVFRNLKKVLAQYAHAAGEVKNNDKYKIKKIEDLIKLLEQALEESENWCKTINININDITDSGEKAFKEIALFDDFAEIILTNDDRKKKYKLFVNTITSLYDSAKPEVYSYPEIKLKKEVFEYLRDMVNRVNTDSSIENAKKKIDDLLDISVQSTGSLVEEPKAEYKIKNYSKIDLSKLDIEKLKEEFKKKKHKNTEFTDLREFMEIKLRQMIRENKTRVSFMERFKQIIEKYNSGSKTIEETYEAATDLLNNLSEEEDRAAQEGMTQEELELFDMLKKEKLTKEQKKNVKLAAKKLIELMKEGKEKVFKKDWEKYRQTRIIVKQAVEKVLDENMPKAPVYNNELFEEKTTTIFNHFLTKANDFEEVA
ncbi:MAG: HsdR family type I site-specific deoxyribonuclease [Bacteroidota bacterium]|nr:HsdR family type I site-specific deoxyribonuclease [Bacteroidota bacterium]